jgi:hypothetical protein
MTRPKQHQRGRRACGGLVRAIYTRMADEAGRVRWVSLGWICDSCHKWAESEWELTM